MASVREHYDGHLGPVYGWMIGPLDIAKEAARTELRAAGLSDGADRVAVDLGAGPGAHAVALAEMGYAVTAFDSCAELLEELRTNAGDRIIKCVNDDLLHLRRHCQDALDVIVCMGDTLTHVSSQDSVDQETTLTVHDLLYERTDAGWTLRVSSYPKLRLSPEWARSTLNRLGLVATLEAGPRGMVRLVAAQPA